MKALLCAIVGVAMFIGATAYAQVDRDHQTTKKEMMQLHELAADHASAMFPSYDINWNDVLVYRVDLDGDGRNEAMIFFQGLFYCGASACDILIVKSIASKATVASIVNDSSVFVLKDKTNGWREPRAHYYDYKWDGENYERVCRPGGVCENG